MDRVEAAQVGNYANVPGTHVATFTTQNGKHFTATVSVDSSGNITGRVVTPPN